eukprot:scaffold2.g7273.t1
MLARCSSAVETWYSAGVISRETLWRPGPRPPLEPLPPPRATPPPRTVLWRTDGANGLTPDCAKYRDQAYAESAAVDLYGLDAPLCLMGADGAPLEAQPRTEGGWVARGYDPCLANQVQVYMNRTDVQTAMHAIQPGEAPRPWSDCTPQAFSYSVDSLITSMIPVYKELLCEGVRVLIAGKLP